MTDSARSNPGPWVLVSTILASSMAFIDGTALNVALPALQTGLRANGVQLLWVVNAYLLMLAALIPIGGSLGDLLGRKRVFAIGIGLFMTASLVCGIAPSIEFLIGARMVQGVGSALMIPGSLAIISAFFDPSKRGRAIGTWSAVTTIVTVAGPVLGGVLSGAGLWRGVFLINIPIGVEHEIKRIEPRTAAGAVGFIPGKRLARVVDVARERLHVVGGVGECEDVVFHDFRC